MTVVLILAVSVVWVLQSRTSTFNPDLTSTPTDTPIALDFNGIGGQPENDTQALGEVISKGQLVLPADSRQVGIKVVSGNIIPVLKEQAQQEVGALRVVGEMSNLSSSKVKNVQVLLRLFDENEELVATKVGTWNPSTSFTPLSLGETGVYDVVVPGRPPAFAQASVEIRAAEPEEDKNFVSSAVLELRDQNLELKEAQSEGQTVEYFRFTGKLVNRSQREIVNPGVLVWLKNVDNRVYALASQKFTADLLAPGKKLPVELNLIPFSGGELIDYKVKTFGEEF